MCNVNNLKKVERQEKKETLRMSTKESTKEEERAMTKKIVMSPISKTEEGNIRGTRLEHLFLATPNAKQFQKNSARTPATNTKR